MPSLPPALTRELGQGAVGLDGTGTDPYEGTAELVYPLNLAVYDRMRRTDAGTRASLRALKGPILGTPWRLSQRACRPVVLAHVAHELGLLRDADGAYMTREGGVSWLETLRHALLKFDYGHMALEQVYELGPWDMPGVPAPPGLESVVHLHKLAPRMPRTLDGFDVAPDGGLRGIFQLIQVGPQTKRVFIPIEKLVMFVNEREGSDWAGQSVLRASYKHWLLKDAMFRSGAIGVDRQSMGVPVVTYPADSPNGTQAKAQRIASAIRSGDDSGIAWEEGWTLALVGVTGGTIDPVPQIELHDRLASKATLTMFLDLGHDAGARSLGDTFADILVASQNAAAVEVAQEVTDHVIRDLVRHTFGPDEPWPALVHQEIFPDDPAVLEQLGELGAAGLLGPTDVATINAVRRRVGMAPMATPVPGDPGAPDPSATPDGGLTPASGDVVPGTVVTPGAPAVVGPSPTPGATGPTAPARPTAAVGGVPAARQPVVAAAAGQPHDPAGNQAGALSDLARTLESVQTLMAVLASGGPASP